MRRRLTWILPLLAIPALAVLAFGLTRDVRRLPSALVGLERPEFKLAMMDDPSDSISIAEFRGKVVVLNFWASWCGPCIMEHPELVRLSRTYDPEDVVLLGVLFQDDPANGRAFMDYYGGDWPIVVDPSSRTAIRYGVYGVPETFFIGADGKVARRHEYAVTWDLVTTMVDSLLDARGPRPEPTQRLETMDGVDGTAAAEPEGS